jgi:MFS family permease
MLLWSIATWLASYCRTFEQLIVLRASMGLVEACYMPAALALICDYHQGRTRSIAIAIHHTGFVVGLALSGLGGWLAEWQSWHFAFALVGLTGIAYAVVLVLLLRDAPHAPITALVARVPKSGARLGEALLGLFGLGAFVLMLVAHALLNLMDWVVIGWAPVFFQEHFHLTQAVAGVSATGYKNVGLIAGLFIGGLWADRWSRTNARARMLVPAIGILIGGPGILLMANSSVLALAIAGLVIYYLFLAFYDPNTMPVLCEIVDARYRATAYGLLNCVGMISAGLGVYVIGMMRDLKIELRFVFDLGVLVCAICALIYFRLKPGSGALRSDQAETTVESPS